MPSYGPGYSEMQARKRAQARAEPPVVALLVRVAARLDRLDAGDAALAAARAETERLLRVIAERDASASGMVDETTTLRDALAEAESARDEARTSWERAAERAAQAELELQRGRAEIEAAAAAHRSLAESLATAIAERDAAARTADLETVTHEREAAARAAADLETVTQEREAAARAAADLETVTQERDAAAELAAKLQHRLDEERRGRRELAAYSAGIFAELERVRTAHNQLLIDAQATDRERAAATPEAAADLETVTRERDAADRLCRALQGQIDAANRRLAARAAAAAPKSCPKCAEAKRHSEKLVASLRAATDSLAEVRRGQQDGGPRLAELQAELDREREHAAARQQVVAQLRRQLDQAEARLRDAVRPADPAEPGPFVLEHDTGRRLVWWTGELVGDRPVTTGAMQAARPLLTRGEAQAWLGQTRAFARFRVAPVAVQAREASSGRMEERWPLS